MSDIFRLSENTPEVYQSESLDFQLLSRLYDVVDNGFLFDAQTITNILNTKNCNSNMLQLLQTKLGFFTQKKLNDENLYGALQVFKWLVYKKGSKEAIRGAVNLFSKLNNIQKQISVVYNVNETQYESVTIPARTVVIGIEDQIKDISLLDELFRYILPAGIPYYIYFYQNVESFTNAMVQNNAELLFVTDSINAQIRQMMFGYYDSTNDKFYYENTFTTEIEPVDYNLYMDKITNEVYVHVDGIGYTTDTDMPNRLIAGVDTTMLTSPNTLTDSPSTIKNKFLVYQLDYSGSSTLYTVSYYINYQTGDEPFRVIRYRAGDTVTILTMSQQSGYTGQWTDFDPEVTITDNTFIMPDSDVVIKGEFVVNTYDLTYYVDGQQYGEVEQYNYDASITPKTAPTQTGYTFSGWQPEVPLKMPAYDVDIYGTFNINNYWLTYMLNNQQYNRTSYEYNSNITPIANPVQTGYTFSGWSPSVPITMPANDLTISGTLIANKYNVVFNANSSDNVSGTMQPQQFTYDVEQALTTNAFIRTNYDFINWNTVYNGTGISYTDGQLVSNLTAVNNSTYNLYAQWQFKDLLSNTIWEFNPWIDLSTAPSEINLNIYTYKFEKTSNDVYTIDKNKDSNYIQITFDQNQNTMNFMHKASQTNVLAYTQGELYYRYTTASLNLSDNVYYGFDSLPNKRFGWSSGANTIQQMYYDSNNTNICYAVTRDLFPQLIEVNLYDGDPTVVLSTTSVQKTTSVWNTYTSKNFSRAPWVSSLTSSFVKYIYIESGQDVNNPAVYNWLSANAVQKA